MSDRMKEMLFRITFGAGLAAFIGGVIVFIKGMHIYDATGGSESLVADIGAWLVLGAVVSMGSVPAGLVLLAAVRGFGRFIHRL